jgi:hypothetical protein
MNTISGWLQRFSSGWITISAVVIFFVFMVTVMPQQAVKIKEISGEARSPDTSFFYSATELYKMADDYGEEGRQAYIQARFSFDAIFPLVYTAFLCTSLGWITQRTFTKQSKLQYANLMPVFGMVFDFFENISTSVVMARYPDKTPLVDWMAPVFTLVKWIFVTGSFVLLFTSFIIAAWFWVKLKTTDNRTGMQQ